MQPYIEPIHWEVACKIIEKERPDAVLLTMGGQTALEPCAGAGASGRAAGRVGVTMIARPPTRLIKQKTVVASTWR